MSERLLIALALSLSTVAAAETLDDPMRPWRAPEAVAPGSELRYELNAILYSAERRVAIVNGQPVTEGDRVADARVRRIFRNRLELEVGGQIRTLVLADTPRSGFNRSSR